MTPSRFPSLQFSAYKDSSLGGWLPQLAIMVLVTIVYASNIHDFFVSDDFHFLWLNQQYAADGLLARLAVSLQPDGSMFYRPITYLSFWLNYTLFGTSSVGWHSLNLVLHLISTVLVIRLMLRLVDAHWPALCAGLLFGVHFIHAEPVIWISGRTSLLVTVFVLTAVLLESRPREPVWGMYRWLGILFAVLSVFAKESAVVLPLILLTVPTRPYSIDELRMPRPDQSARQYVTAALLKIRNQWPYWAVSILFAGSRFGSIVSSTESQTYRLEIGLCAVKNIAFICSGSAFPLDFRSGLGAWNQWYGNPDAGGLVELVLAIPDVVLGALAAISLWGALLLLGNSAARRSTAWIFVAALPIIFFRGTGERLLYLSSVGAACALTAVVTGWAASLRTLRSQVGYRLCIGIIPAMILLHLAWLADRQRDWRNAAVLSEAIVLELAATGAHLPKDATVYFSGLPDNINGAWVFRSGIDAAFALYAGRPDVTVLTSMIERSGSSTARTFRWDGSTFQDDARPR